MNTASAGAGAQRTIDGISDLSGNWGDNEYTMTKLSTFVNEIQGPEDLSDETFL